MGYSQKIDFKYCLKTNGYHTSSNPSPATNKNKSLKIKEKCGFFKRPFSILTHFHLYLQITHVLKNIIFSIV